ERGNLRRDRRARDDDVGDPAVRRADLHGSLLHDRRRRRAWQSRGRDRCGPGLECRRAVRRLPLRCAAADLLCVQRACYHPGVAELAAAPAPAVPGMSLARLQRLLPPALLVLAVVAPFALPAYRVELTLLWIMIVLALSWDILGGQMGYNSFGNIAFFGIGVYTATIVQIGLYHDVGAYTAAPRHVDPRLTPA